MASVGHSKQYCIGLIWYMLVLKNNNILTRYCLEEQKGNMVGEFHTSAAHWISSIHGPQRSKEVGMKGGGYE